MSETRKSGAKSDRDALGRFAPGNPGKPPGTRHRATRAVEELLDGEAEALTRKALKMALDGDATALRLCLERIAPARKSSPVTFSLPEMQTAEDAASAMGMILRAVSEGYLTPAEATTVAGLIDGFRRALETTDLEQRIASLEGRR